MLKFIRISSVQTTIWDRSVYFIPSMAAKQPRRREKTP